MRPRAAKLARMNGWRSSDGHSLVELLVATAVVGVVMAGILGILSSSLRAYHSGAARVEAQQAARIALDRMLRELREAGYDPKGAGIAPIVTAETTRVTFDRDLDGDGVIDPTSERVTYVLRAGESVLRRDAGGGAQPVIGDVRRLALAYFDRRGLATTDPAAAVSVQIDIEVGSGASRVAMRTQVALRNRVL